MYPNDPDRPDLEALVRKAHAERAYYLAELLSGGLAALGRGRGCLRLLQRFAVFDEGLAKHVSLFPRAGGG